MDIEPTSQNTTPKQQSKEECSSSSGLNIDPSPPFNEEEKAMFAKID